MNEWNNLGRRLLEATVEEQMRETVGASEVVPGPELDPKEVRKCLEGKYGQVWDSYTLARDFEVIQFTPPLVTVRRKADGVMGTVIYQHDPRFYWGFSSGWGQEG